MVEIKVKAGLILDGLDEKHAMNRDPTDPSYDVEPVILEMIDIIENLKEENATLAQALVDLTKRVKELEK